MKEDTNLSIEPVSPTILRLSSKHHSKQHRRSWLKLRFMVTLMIWAHHRPISFLVKFRHRGQECLICWQYARPDLSFHCFSITSRSLIILAHSTSSRHPSFFVFGFAIHGPFHDFHLPSVHLHGIRPLRPPGSHGQQ